MVSELDEAWLEGAIARQRRVDRLRQELDGRLSTTEVSVCSPDRLVEVCVGADGAIRKVDVVGPLAGISNVEVSRSIRVAMDAAAAAAGAARRTLYLEALGDELPSDPELHCRPPEPDRGYRTG